MSCHNLLENGLDWMNEEKSIKEYTAGKVINVKFFLIIFYCNNYRSNIYLKA